LTGISRPETPDVRKSVTGGRAAAFLGHFKEIRIDATGLGKF
jgi:hypothetical protein